MEENVYFFSGFDVVDFNRVTEPSRVLFVTVHKCQQIQHPVSDKDLHQIFSHYGSVEKMGYSYDSAVEFLFQLDSISDAQVAQRFLNCQSLYDNCCRLQVQFFHWKVEEESVTHVDSLVEDGLSNIEGRSSGTSYDDSKNTHQQISVEVDSADEVADTVNMGVINEKVVSLRLNETACAIDVAVDDGHIIKASKSGLGSASDIEIHDTIGEFLKLHGCCSCDVFDPGISSIDELLTSSSYYEKWGLENFFGSWNLSDIYFIVGEDGRFVLAHNIILGVASGHTQSTEPQLDFLKMLDIQFEVPPLVKQCEEISERLKLNNKLFNSYKSVELSYPRWRPDCLSFPSGLPLNLQKLENLSSNGKYSDLNIYMEEDLSPLMRSHIHVLSLWSAPFSKILTNEKRESCSLKAFKAILHFIYNNNLNKKTYGHMFGITMKELSKNTLSLPKMLIHRGPIRMMKFSHKDEMDFDPFWLPIHTSSVKAQMCFLLLKKALTNSPDMVLNLADNPNLKHLIVCGDFDLGWTLMRNYDGFNGPGFSHVAFDFVLALIRDYDGFNGPGHTLRTRCL